ncbi:MAG: DUF2971 domain-containing protein [Bacteroidetes bacterium]|nr:DUF2971 domain-containing protein [Bacteroidota bacterium]MBU2376428.1 DUF2971 domain-containing protein [Bacteroidota bacterium]
MNFYERTLLRNYFPNFVLKGNSNFNLKVEGIKGINNLNGSLPSLFKNRNLYQSPYYLEDKTDFIHYTSVEAVFEIIKSNQLRLHDLSKVNDPKEIIYIDDEKTSQKLHKDNITFNENSKDAKDLSRKRKSFSLSMCEIEDFEKPDTFSMWKEYGKSGEGAALILNVDGIHRYDWYNFHISKIHYGNENSLIKDYFNKHQQFLIDNKVSFLNFKNFITPVLAFHKSKYYEAEKEVRLFTRLPYYSINNSIESEFLDLFSRDYSLSDKNNYKSFINLNLRNDYNYKDYNHLNFKNIPSIKIEKIILGYKHTIKESVDLENHLNHLNKKRDLPLVKVEISHLKNELGF